MNENIAIIGGGPAGIMTAINIKNKNANITIFEKNKVLSTLLYTGGGRCNLAYNEFNNSELIKFYPRGSNELKKIFSKFSTKDTINFFQKIGLDLYTQQDKRIFPKSNNANDVRDYLVKELNKKKNIKIIFSDIEYFEYKDNKFIINNLIFDKLIIATGGNKEKINFNNSKIKKSKISGYNIAEKLGHNIIDLKPALQSLKIKEDYLLSLSGLSFKNLKCSLSFNNKKQIELTGDLLFTHKGISAPLAYKISSYFAYINFSIKDPLVLKINLISRERNDLNEILLSKSKKNTINILSEYLPRSFLELLFNKLNIDVNIKNSYLNKQSRINLINSLTEFNINVIGRLDDGEIVTAGGIDLKEINLNKLESKIVKNLYFAGEILNIDGLTGGFNLQICWSTGFIVGTNI